MIGVSTALEQRGFRYVEFPTELAWLDARRQHVTASDFAALLGVDPYRSIFSVWADKVQPPAHEDNQAMRAGRKLEPVVAEMFAEDTGANVVDMGRWTLCVSTGAQHEAATLDRLLRMKGRQGTGVLEIKAPGYLQAEKWAEGPPLPVLIQVQAQLAVTGYQWAEVACLIGGQDFRHFEVERNEELIEVMHDAVASFWPFVEKGEMPEVDPSNATFEAVKRLYPRDTGRTVAIHEAGVLEAFKALEAAREVKRAAEVAEGHAKAIILAACQDAGKAIVGSDTWTLGTVTKPSYTVQPSSYRQILKQEPKKGRKQR